MKTKLKYLLFGLLTLVSLSSTTHAITLRDASYGNTYTYYSTSNGYNLYKNGNFSYNCLSSIVASSPENDKRYTKGPAICDDGEYKNMDYYSSSAPIYRGSYRLPSPSKATYYYNNNSRYIFSISAVEVGDEIKIHKSKFKISSSGIYNIKSKRGSNVYSVASMRGPGMTFIMKDEDQVRWATYVNNMYMLDGYAIFLPQGGSSVVFDSYKNKAYEYKEFWTSQDNNLRGTSLFPKLMNTVPTNVYNIEWNVGSDYSAYYSTSSDNVKFSLMEKRAGTKEDLKIIQQDLKDSITSLNEYSHYYLGLTPEDLQGISGSPKVPDAPQSSNNTATPAKPSDYNQCVNYWEDLKIYASHANKCFEALYQKAEKQNLDMQTTLKPYYDILDWNGQGSLHIPETSPVYCNKTARVSEKHAKKYGEKFAEIQKLTLDYSDNPNLIDVNLKCGAKVNNSLSGLPSTALTGDKIPFYLKENQCLKDWTNIKELYELYKKCETGVKPDFGPIGLDGTIITTACSGKEARISWLKKYVYIDNWNDFEKKFNQYLSGDKAEIIPSKRCNKEAIDQINSLPLMGGYKGLSRTDKIGLFVDQMGYYSSLFYNSFLDLKNLPQKLYDTVFGAYDRGKKSIAYYQCSNTFVIESFDIFAYLLFFLIIFYLFRL